MKTKLIMIFMSRAATPSIVVDPIAWFFIVVFIIVLLLFVRKLLILFGRKDEKDMHSKISYLIREIKKLKKEYLSLKEDNHPLWLRAEIAEFEQTFPEKFFNQIQSDIRSFKTGFVHLDIYERLLQSLEILKGVKKIQSQIESHLQAFQLLEILGSELEEKDEKHDVSQYVIRHQELADHYIAASLPWSEIIDRSKKLHQELNEL